MHSKTLAMYPGYTPGRLPLASNWRAAAPCITLHRGSINN